MHCLDTPFELIRLEETDSTSSHLRMLCETDDMKEFTVVTADYQTAGRGQRGNSWEAEKGKNLLFSLLLVPDFLQANRQFILSQIIALGIKEELDRYADGFSIKWPNDIYWKERKICGMLIENDLTGQSISRCIAGIGININQTVFHSPAPNPVSLAQITGKEHDRHLVLRNILQRIRQYYKEVQERKSTDIPARYYEALFRKNTFAGYRDKSGRFIAKIVRIEPSGLLILQREDGTEHAYAFKEISYEL